MADRHSSAVSRNALVQLSGVARDSVKLMRQELLLARQETIEKITPAVRSVAMILGGGIVTVFGTAYLLQAVVRVLSTRMPPWLASLVSGGALTLGGIAFALRGGQQLRRLDLVPQKTINTLREDKEWLVHQIKSRLR
ncbi:MAG: phage holin family protein [Chloroflexota bacterium]|nr:phage holin family protein [Chloroflexota bacterium]